MWFGPTWLLGPCLTICLPVLFASDCTGSIKLRIYVQISWLIRMFIKKECRFNFSTNNRTYRIQTLFVDIIWCLHHILTSISRDECSFSSFRNWIYLFASYVTCTFYNVHYHKAKNKQKLGWCDISSGKFM